MTLENGTQQESEAEPLIRARQLFSAGQSRSAERLLRQHADSAGAHTLLREYLVAEGRNDEALELVAGSDDLVDRAVEAFVKGNYTETLASCDGRLDISDNAAARLHRARALHNLNQPAQALKEFRDLVKAYPAFAQAWAACAHALRVSGQDVAACQAYERALKISPGFQRARLDLGITLLNADRAEEAQACFEFVLSQNSDNVEAMILLALALRLNGQSGLAKRRLKRALILQPDNPDAHRYLAGVFHESGAFSEAVDHLKRALAARPDDPDMLADLALAYERSGQVDEARAAVVKGLEVASAHPQLNLLAARAERAAGDLEAARTRLVAMAGQSVPARLVKPHSEELKRVEQALDSGDCPV